MEQDFLNMKKEGVSQSEIPGNYGQVNMAAKQDVA